MEDQETTSAKKPMSSLVVALLIILVIGGIGIFLVSSKKANNSSSTNMVTGTTTTPTAAMKASPAASNEGAMSPSETKFTVHASNFKFDTTTMKVKKGDKVTVTFMDDSGTHDWVLDEFNAKTKILPAGQSETVSFVADKTGTFEYYCSVGNHRAMGMVGELTVQ